MLQALRYACGKTSDNQGVRLRFLTTGMSSRNVAMATERCEWLTRRGYERKASGALTAGQSRRLSRHAIFAGLSVCAPRPHIQLLCYQQLWIALLTMLKLFKTRLAMALFTSNSSNSSNLAMVTWDDLSHT